MKEITYQPCPICQSRGHVECRTCRGNGLVLNPRTWGKDEPSMLKCNICLSTGKITCNGCNGTGRILKNN